MRESFAVRWVNLNVFHTFSLYITPSASALHPRRWNAITDHVVPFLKSRIELSEEELVFAFRRDSRGRRELL